MSVQTAVSKSEDNSRQSRIQNRTFVISRNSGPASFSGSYSIRRSYNVGSITPGVYQALSSTGITSFKGDREREKREMQNLNERLASYIERVHFLDAQCKKLEAENEALRNRKVEDLQPIRNIYENELSQARKVIDELSITKGQAEAKFAGLQDEITSLRELIVTYENHGKDYRKKIESLTNQIGEYEGEIHTLRLRVGSLEDENSKTRDLLEKVQEASRRLRADLDAETAAHIEADCLAQTKTEEVEFYRDLLDQLELMKPEPIQIKGMDYADFWKSELAKCVREIQLAYDEKIDLIQQDYEVKYSAQINTLKTGNVKDGMQLQHSQDEVKRLRSQLQEKGASYADLTSRIAVLQAERDELLRLRLHFERELELLQLKYNEDIVKYEAGMESFKAQIDDLLNAKLSLELEIACYRKLLEGEESRVSLRTLVATAIGASSTSSSHSISSSSSSTTVVVKGGSSATHIVQQSSAPEKSGSLTVQRSSKGPIAFASIDTNGGNVVIENTTSGKKKAKDQNLWGWKIVKVVNGKDAFVVPLNDSELEAGRSFTVWAKGTKDRVTTENEMISDIVNFGTGSCIWKLMDADGNETATLTAKFAG